MANALTDRLMSDGPAVDRPVTESTIFAELGAAAHRRSVRSLAMQLVVCLCVAVLFTGMAPTWWSIGVLCSVGSVYALWGLVDRAVSASPHGARVLPRLVAGLGTGLSVVGVLGLAAAIFAGRGQSPYNACGPRATTAYCAQLKHPLRVTHLP